METKEFLEKLLPTTDYYTLWIKGKTNYSFTDLDECVAYIQQVDKSALDVYFALGKHNTLKRRTKETATFFKALGGDIDVGVNKPYASQRDAARALLTAVQRVQLPEPMIVSSGNGLHFYYPFDVAVKATDWERLSIALHQALTANGLKVDSGKISDRSMVLRPVGTHNKKDPHNWKLVRCLQDTVARDPRKLAAILKPWITAAPAPKQTPVSSAVMNAVLSGATINPVPLADIAGCQQIAALLADKGATAPEPLWRASLGIAKYCTDQGAAIEALASGYPGFSLEENWEKLRAWKGTGPPTCEHFEHLNPKGCEGCPVKGHIHTPTAYATSVATNLTDPYLDEIKFPKGYSYNGKAIIYKSSADAESLFVSPYLIYPIAQYTDTEKRGTTVKLRVKYPVEGWQTLELEHTSLSSDGKEFNNWLYAKRLWFHDGSAKVLRSYLVTYLRELTQAVQTNLLYDHYGWQADGRFLLGDKLIGPDGTEQIQHNKLATQISQGMISAGDVEPWAKATALFDQPNMHFHGFAFLVGLAGPLMAATGLEALLVNMYSPDSGSGKTLTGMYALSAWGAPDKLFLTIRDTDNALYKTLGTINNVCAYIDEITMVEPERLCDLVYSFTQGREKIRMRRDITLSPPALWQMPILSSSNQDLHELVSTRVISEAQRQRILQLPLHRSDMFEKGGDNVGFKLMKMIKANYGVAGAKIIEEIIRLGGLDWASRTFHAGIESIKTKYDITFLGQERYAQAAVVMADMIGALCKRIGVIKFDYERAIREVAKYFVGVRDHNTNVSHTPIDTINQFLLEHSAQIVYYRETRDGAQRTQRVLEPVPRNAVARLEIVSNKQNVFLGGYAYISRNGLRKWCASQGIDVTQLLLKLAALRVRYNDAARYSIYKGVHGMGGVGQTRCVQIDLGSNKQLAKNGYLALGDLPSVDISERIHGVEYGT